jgi:hypothetical protein
MAIDADVQPDLRPATGQYIQTGVSAALDLPDGSRWPYP